MKSNIIGRSLQINQLEKAINSPNAELVAVYGRRRIGKTFLIKEYFSNKFDFYATGIFEGSQHYQIAAFCQGFEKDLASLPKNWMDAFIELRNYLKTKRKKRLIVFLDELPWFDVPPGHFLKAFEWFWNSWASTRPGLKLIVCGSATSWMINKFISGKGGLYNRTTRHIYLTPFNLAETELLLNKKGPQWSKELILEAYMVFGGVPYYLQLLEKDESLPENINRLFFSPNAVLKKEFDFLLKSLFKEDEYYKAILNAIASKNKGISRGKIISSLKISDNGRLTQALKNLIMCDFVREYNSFGKRKKDSLFQLIDPFSLFYKRFVENVQNYDRNHWINIIGKPAYNTWRGIAFEEVCLLHVDNIKKSLGIEGVATQVGGWYFKGAPEKELSGAQIDLVINREDRVVDLCEMKFSDNKFKVDANLADDILNRRDIFREATNTKKALRNVLITPYGIKEGKHSYVFDKVLGLNDLFKF